jgi:tectonin beta-propeller repeat-containing protein 1
MWEHVTSDQALNSISCGPFTQVWATGKNGSAYWRIGITPNKLEGDSWAGVEPPSGCQLKRISVGLTGVWALDNSGKLYVRKEVTRVFPEGTHWQCINLDPSIISELNYFFTNVSF